MFDKLNNKFVKVLKYLKSEVKLTDENMSSALKEIRLSMLEADVNFRVVKEFISNVKEKLLGEEVRESLNPYQHVVKIVKTELEAILGREQKELIKSERKPSVIMLTGLQGTGKTTTAGKLAYFLKTKKGKSTLLCSFDLKRPAAAEQLKVIAKEIDVKCFNPESKIPEKIADELLKIGKEYGYDYIIADTAGRLHIDDDLMDELSRVKKILAPAETIFVADAMTGQDAVNSALSFSERIGIDSIILTKVDSDTRGGAALSVVKVTGKPIKFAGVGEKYEDFQIFYPDRFASQILGMGDVLSLIEKAEEKFDKDQAEKLTKKILKNEFTLEDFLSQLNQMKKLGSLPDIAGMIPGVDVNQVKNGMSEKKVSHMIAIINSMNKKEREKPKIIDGKRRYRISKGSGRPVAEVNRLIKQYFEMKKVMKKPMFRKMLKKFDILSKIG